MFSWDAEGIDWYTDTRVSVENIKITVNKSFRGKFVTLALVEHVEKIFSAGEW